MKSAWKRFNVFMIVAVVSVWAFGSGASVSEAAKYKLVVGSGGGNIGAPIHVAKTKGYFAQEDLAIDHKIFSSGAAMVEALAAGGVELGHSGDLPFVSLAAANVPACIIAQNGQDKDYLEIFVGKDLGMTKPTDFYGKKIGLRFASAAHILWINFIERYKLDAKKIRVVNLTPNDLIAAFKNKDVDGGVVWYPHLTTAEQGPPDAFCAFPVAQQVRQNGEARQHPSFLHPHQRAESGPEEQAGRHEGVYARDAEVLPVHERFGKSRRVSQYPGQGVQDVHARDETHS